jgi:anti-sigma B factor antagonist
VAALEEINPFSVSVQTEQDPIVFTVTGELDLSTAGQLSEAIADRARPDARACIDLSGCDFIDSTGLQVIVAAAREFQRSGGELSVTGLRGDVEALFRMSGLLLEGSALVYRDRL